jgi:PilZ domain-containing protein
VDIRQSYAAWSAITEELSVRGCRLLARELPRLGATLDMTLSSDLFSEDLETDGEVVWIDAGRIGVSFHDRGKPLRAGVLSVTDWIEMFMAYGSSSRSPDGHVVPVIMATAAERALERRTVVLIRDVEAARSRVHAARNGK